MFKIVFAVFVAFGVSEAYIPAAGKCKSVAPIGINFNSLIQTFPYWKTLYVPEDTDFTNVDSEFRTVQEYSSNSMVGTMEITTNDNVQSLYTVRLTYGPDFIIHEESEDATGNKSYFKWIPLLLTNNFAGFYYRCSENGTLDIDTRFLMIAVGQIFSVADEQLVLAVDKEQNFVGGIRKLNNALSCV